jgi:hypothetical protein
VKKHALSDIHLFLVKKSPQDHPPNHLHDAVEVAVVAVEAQAAAEEA